MTANVFSLHTAQPALQRGFIALSKVCFPSLLSSSYPSCRSMRHCAFRFGWEMFFAIDVSRISICCWKPFFVPYQSRFRTSLIIQSFFFSVQTLSGVQSCHPLKKMHEKSWDHSVIWAGFNPWGRDQWAAQQSQCSLSSWSWPEERWCSMWSNYLEAKLGLRLHRPKVAPQKSLVWQPSPWFDSQVPDLTAITCRLELQEVKGWVAECSLSGDRAGEPRAEIWGEKVIGKEKISVLGSCK